MAKPVVLAIDIVLGLLIGPPGHRTEQIYFERCESGEWEPILLDLALYCAMCCVRATDRVDHARFARVLRYATLRQIQGRETGAPLPPPSSDEIEHWRAVVFGHDDN